MIIRVKVLFLHFQPDRVEESEMFAILPLLDLLYYKFQFGEKPAFNG